VVETHRAAAEARGVRLILDITRAPRSARFDPRHMEQAVVALVTNAIEASPKGSGVEVCGLVDGGGWTIRVADQGPGVPADLREKVFRPYFTTKKEGSGIGLAVAHQVVMQHGGQLRVAEGPMDGRTALGGGGTGLEAPKAGVGAVFMATLPLTGLAEPGQRRPTGGTNGEDSGH
jgi:signal transduction histidine kinase